MEYTPQQKKGIANSEAFEVFGCRFIKDYSHGMNWFNDFNQISTREYAAFRNWDLKRIDDNEVVKMNSFREYARRLEEKGLPYLTKQLDNLGQIMLEDTETEASLFPKNLGELIDLACGETTLENHLAA
jgi:hypothetical protein